MKIGIRTSVLFLTLIPAIAIALVLIVYLTSIRSGDLAQSFAERGQTLANQLAWASEYPLHAGEQTHLSRLTHSVLQEAGVSAVIIEDAQGHILAWADHPPFQTTAFTLWKASPQWFEAPIYRTVNTTDRPEPIGRVRLQLAAETLVQRQQEIVSNSLLLILGCLLLAVLLGQRISRKISDPIIRMENAVRELRDGRLDSPVQGYASGTLSSLERHINTMVATLKASHEHLQEQVDEATAELRETMEELEIKNVELDIARKKALQASRVKSEFLANMSHEIRTPMNGVMGYIALLSKTKLDRTQQGYLQTLRASAENLMVILNDTLDFSKIEAGKFTIRKRNFDLREVLENAVMLFAANAHYKGLSLILDIEPDVPSHLVGDAPRIAQIITNLVSNAIKSTDQGDVEVRVSKSQESARTITLNLEVRDTGIGIAPTDQQRLFKAFDQLDSSTTRRHGGTGLGLAITHRLVSLMRGTIRVDSRPGEGAAFYVSLVVDRQEQDPAEEARLWNMPVLLISGDGALTRAVTHILEFGGALPHHVRDFAAATQWLQNPAHDGAALRDIIIAHHDSQEVPPAFFDAVRAHGLDRHCALILIGASEDQPGTRCFKRIFHTVYFANTPPTSRELLNFLKTRPQPAQDQPDHKDHPPGEVDSLPATAQTKARVLLADDNLINRRLTRIFLNQLGAQVVEASTGQETVEACRNSCYDLIFMDIHMPEMDGLEATQRIRNLADNPNSEVPIVALTADAMNRERTQYLKAGMNDHLSKPITEAALRRMLEKWCPGPTVHPLTSQRA